MPIPAVNWGTSWQLLELAHKVKRDPRRRAYPIRIDQLSPDVSDLVRSYPSPLGDRLLSLSLSGILVSLISRLPLPFAAGHLMARPEASLYLQSTSLTSHDADRLSQAIDNINLRDLQIAIRVMQLQEAYGWQFQNYCSDSKKAREVAAWELALYPPGVKKPTLETLEEENLAGWRGAHRFIQHVGRAARDAMSLHSLAEPSQAFHPVARSSIEH
ncbi:hypothetical protein JCM8547_008056 [Rhodosporidiobolus lusitaniae]